MAEGDEGGMVAKPPLIRHKVAAVWQHAYYTVKYSDKRAVNTASYAPLGAGRVGPFSTYEAAVACGETDGRAPGHQHYVTHFVIDHVFVAPDQVVEFIDKPTTMQDEYDSDGLLAGDFEGFK